MSVRLSTSSEAAKVIIDGAEFVIKSVKTVIEPAQVKPKIGSYDTEPAQVKSKAETSKQKFYIKKICIH